MSPDPVVEQVAVVSDPADAAAAQAEQAQATQGAAAEANGETTPEPDFKAEWEKTKAELAQERTSKLAAEKRAADAENLVRTQAGAQSASDRRLNEFARELQRQREMIKAGLTSADPSAEIGRLETTHQNEDQASFSSFIAGQSRTNTDALHAAGFADADWNNEELADGFALWEAARNVGDRTGIERASKSLMRGIKRMQAAKTAAPVGAPSPQPAPAPAVNGATRRIANMDTGQGIGAGAESLQALVNRLYSGKFMTDADIAKAQDAMDNKGIYPG